jgi:diguanylate cyclase (GGDEF)-like protein/PAS domain S-box-containing protein
MRERSFNPQLANVLVICQDESMYNEISERLTYENCSNVVVSHENTFQSSLDALASQNFDAVILDMTFFENDAQALNSVQSAAPNVPIVVVARPEDERALSPLRRHVPDLLISGRLEVQSLSRTLQNLIDRRSAEEALRTERERAEVAFNSIADAVLCTDVSGRVTYLNRVAEKLTGWSNETAVGRPVGDVFQVIDGRARQTLSDALPAAILHAQPLAPAINRILVRKDGVELSVEDSVAPVRDHRGRLRGTVIVFRDISAARALELRLSHLAEHDVLTDLPNRALFNDRLTQAIAMAQRHRRQLAVLFLDCDNFKKINEALGHGTGDLLLKSLAQRLVGAVRNSDTVSRHGGDEFVILLSELEKPEDAGLCASKILKALAVPHRIGRHELPVTVSAGVALYPTDGRNAEALIESADVALYEAKQAGGNSFRPFRQQMSARAAERLSVDGSLLRALERSELRLHYQPRINLTTGAVVGVEALVRWDHPERGLISPAEFLPIAEQSGLIIPIGQWVLGEACRQSVRWRVAGLGRVTVAVNVSSVEFRNPGYLQGIATMLADSRLDGRLLELELNESLLALDAEVTGVALRGLRDLGVGLTLDDFGTGSSSLSNLRRYPISTLKIDRSFVRELSSSADDRTLVETIIGMGRSLGQTVIAEGIETDDQLGVLRGLGCSEGQGFHFCRPLPANDFATYLAASQRRSSLRGTVAAVQ